MSADAQLAEVAARQGGAFTTEQACHAGLTREARRYRVQTGRWVRLSTNVFLLAGAPLTWKVRVFAALAGSPPGSVASHRTAARLYRLPGFTSDWLEITVPHGRRLAPRPARTRHSRRLPSHHIRHPQGVPTTSVARTIADLAGILHPKQTERALDNALSSDLVTTEALWRVHHDLNTPGRAGIAVLRHLLQARGDGYVAPASELERLLIDLLRANQLPMPEREVDLGDPDSDGWIGRVEFVYREARLLIEVDGRRYHTALLDREHDRRRDNAFVAAGWRVLRITYEMLTAQPQHVAGLIRRALRAAA